MLYKTPPRKQKKKQKTKTYNITDQCNDEQKIKNKYITDLL